MTSRVTYIADLRTECKHIRSSNTFITDAPTDNKGQGEAFSPTDTVATALASCVLTVMGIKARTMDLLLDGSTAEVTKVMASDPRRISEIKVTFNMNVSADEKQRQILEHTGNTCPVHHSLHPDIKKDIVFKWK